LQESENIRFALIFRPDCLSFQKKGTAMLKICKTVLLLVFVVIFYGTIDTSRGSNTTDGAIERSIVNEASITPSLRTAKVKIAVENGYVVLYGTVEKYIQKMVYERIAWKTVGVIEVDNEIRVTPLSPLADPTIERKIKEIIKTYDKFQGLNFSVSVKAGAVDIIIKLNNPADVLFLKKKIAEIDGVISIDIMAKFIASIPLVET
jgi:hypothetical protein